MALEMAPAVIHLKETSTGRTLAKLEDPYGQRASWQTFSPDGTRLVVVASWARAIHVWDLRAIRMRLKEMNLDWDWPEFPGVATEATTASPVSIELVPAALDLIREQRFRQNIDDGLRALKAKPESADHCNNLAWAYLTAPEALRNVEAAVPLAEKAVRLKGESANHRNTLGVAYYRAGRYREAEELFRSNLEGQADRALAYDLYFLAMSLHRLGQTAPARNYYDWAVRWTRMLQQNLSPTELDEFAAFRAEATEVLSINRKNYSLPEAVKDAEQADRSMP
jgi:tetratricopeptide (TPR) repeat protein